MLSSSNQPAQVQGTAKTHKFDDINEIAVDQLKFRPIIAQTGTYMYKTAQVISEYLKPLHENNNFVIKNTQNLAQLIREQPPLEENEEYASYDVNRYFRTFSFMTSKNIFQKKSTSIIYYHIYVAN